MFSVKDQTGGGGGGVEGGWQDQTFYVIFFIDNLTLIYLKLIQLLKDKNTNCSFCQLKILVSQFQKSNKISFRKIWQ